MPKCPLYLLSGNDETRLLNETRRLVQQLAGPEADELSLEICKETDERGPEATLLALLGAIQTPPFMGGVKTVWLSQFSAFGMEPPQSEKDPRGVAGALVTLSTMLAQGLPEGVQVVLSGPGLDKRKRLARAIEAAGEVRYYERPDPSKAAGRAELARLLQEESQRCPMVLSREVVEYLTDLIGGDTGRLANEVEKLFCFAGANPTLEQAEEICCGNREEAFWVISGAIGERNLKQALDCIDRLLSVEKDPDGAVIAQVRFLAKILRELFDCVLLTSYLKLKPSARLGDEIGRLTAAQRERFKYNKMVEKYLDAAEKTKTGKPNTWAIDMRAGEATRYNGVELQKALSLTAETDRLLVSSSLPPRLLLETLVTRIIRGDGPRRRAA